MEETISRKESDARWLACLIDGEGTVTVYWWKPHYTEHKTIRAYVDVSNTDPRLLQKATEILSEQQIGFWVSIDKRRKSPERLVSGQVVVSGYGRTKKLLEWVFPYLVSKRERAAVVLEAIRYRQERGFKKGDGFKTDPEAFLENDDYLNRLVACCDWLKKNPPSPLLYTRQAHRPMTVGQSSETARWAQIASLFGQDIAGKIQSSLRRESE